MTASAFAVDHVGLGVRTLEAGRQVLAQLGFRLTPLSLHVGPGPDGRPVAWGSGNHCAMFHDGYFELIGQVEAGGSGRIADMVAHYEGLHIIALRCANADAAQRELAARGAPVEAVMALERDAPYGPQFDELRRARFRLVGFNRDAVREARIQLTEHLTPEVLWQPHLLAHPNGVQSIDEVFFQCADPAAVAARFARYFAASVDADGAGRRIVFARGAWRFQTPQDCAALFGDASSLPVPAPVGVAFSVRSLAGTQGVLDAAGIEYRTFAGGGIIVPARVSCGAALVFREGAYR